MADCMDENTTTTDSDKCGTASAWIQCICVVTFDLEFGQAMEVWRQRFMCFRVDRVELLSLCYTIMFLLYSSVGLSQRCQIVWRRQNQLVLLGVPRLKLRLYGWHTVSRQDKVFSNFESQSMPYQLQRQVSSLLTSWPPLFVRFRFLPTNQGFVTAKGLFSKSMFIFLIHFN